MLQLEKIEGNERFSTFPQYLLEVGGINGLQYKSKLSSGGVYVLTYGGQMLDRLPNPNEQETVPAVKLPLRDIGIRDSIYGPDSYNKVVRAARKEGLDLLPELAAAETALNHADMIGEGEWVTFLSETITDRHGDRRVFALNRDGGELGLDGDWTDSGWYPDRLVVARLR